MSEHGGGGGEGGGIMVREIFAKFGFDMNDGPLKEAHEKINQLVHSVGLAGLSFGAAAGSFFALAHSTAEAGHEALLAAQRYGINAQKFQELEYAATKAHVSTEQFGIGLKTLATHLYSAATGSKEAQLLFARLGVQAFDPATGKALGMDVIMGQLANRFKSMPDGMAKTAIATQLFGRSGAMLVPMLNRGAEGLKQLGIEAREFGVVLDEETLEASERFMKAWGQNKAIMLGFSRQLGAQFLPMVTRLMLAFNEFAKKNHAKIFTALKNIFQALGKYVGILWFTFKRFGEALHGFSRILGGVGNAAKILAVLFGAMITANLLSGIGSATIGILKMARGIALAELATAGYAILIGTLVVAIGLLTEDMYQFFEGNESLIGRFMQSFPRMGEYIQNTILPTFQSMYQFMRLITSEGWTWGDIFKSLGVILVNALLAPLRMALNIVGTIARVIGHASDQDAGRWFENAGQGLLDSSKFFNITPGSAPTAQAATSNNTANNSAQSVQVNAPMTFTIPPNADPAKISSSVKEGVADGLDGILRNSQRSFTPQSARAY